jgi:uncharacterized membrane protein YbhN (UPF0104 family)
VGRGLLSAGLGLVVLVLVAAAVARTELGSDALLDLWARARPAPILGAVGLMSLAFAFMALRWRALLPPGSCAPVAGLTAIICSGLLLNYAVPGPFGEVGAAWLAHRRYRLDFAAALAASVAARLIGLATAAFLAVTVWSLGDLPVPASAERVVAAAALVLAVGGAGLVALAALPRVWKTLSARIAARLALPGRAGRWVARLDAAVASLADALAEVVGRGVRGPLVAAMWALCGHCTVVAGIALAAAALGAHPDPAGLLFTYATTTAGVVALFALPGSQVGWDAMFFALLVATSGLSATDSLAIAVVVRVQQLAIMGFGALALAWLLPSARSDGLHPGG